MGPVGFGVVKVTTLGAIKVRISLAIFGWNNEHKILVV